MPTTTVNMLTVVHKKSGGVSTAFPDICKTPTPAGGVPAPIPYPNIAFSKDTANGSTTVKVDGQSIMLLKSNFSTSTGDEPGSLGGIISQIIKGKALPITASFDVTVDGDFVFRLFDMMLQNANPPPNTPPGILIQAPLTPYIPWLNPPKWQVKWSKGEAKCGDEVDILVQAMGGDPGYYLSMTVARAPHELPVTYFVTAISGGSAKIPWVTLTGPSPKNKVQLDIYAFGAGEYAKSSSPLKIVVPEEARQAGSKRNRTVPQMTPVLQPDGTYTYTQGTGLWGWDYGYDLEIKDGIFKVTGRIKLVARGGAVFGARHKRGWKAEIEAIWTRKWREHRKKCKRGKDCKCWGGCCLFPVVFECLFVGSGEFAEVEVWAGNPDTYGTDASGAHNKWWNSGTWFMERCGHEGNQAGVRAHEFGHTIGLYDEYRNGAIFVPTDASGNVTGPPPRPNVPGSLMGPNGLGIKRNHLDEFHQWFLGKANDEYTRERL